MGRDCAPRIVPATWRAPGTAPVLAVRGRSANVPVNCTLYAIRQTPRPSRSEKFTRRPTDRSPAGRYFQGRGRRNFLFRPNLVSRGPRISRSVHGRDTAQNLQPSWVGRRRGGLILGRRTVVRALRVLIVDDDRDSSEALGALLARAGADVALADSARQAFCLFQERRFDVIVSDISMPGEDGLSLIHRIRSSEAREGSSRMLAIALTTGDRAPTIAAGFDEYFQKPLDLDALLSLLPSSRGREKSLRPSRRRTEALSGRRQVRARDQRGAPR